MNGRNRAALIHCAGVDLTTGNAGSTSTSDWTSSGVRDATCTPMVPPIELPTRTERPSSCSRTEVTRRASWPDRRGATWHPGPTEADQVDGGDGRAEAVGERAGGGFPRQRVRPEPVDQQHPLDAAGPSARSAGCQSTAWIRTPSTSSSYDRPVLSSNTAPSSHSPRVGLASWRAARPRRRARAPAGRRSRVGGDLGFRVPRCPMVPVSSCGSRSSRTSASPGTGPT